MISPRDQHNAECTQAQFERHCAALDAGTRQALRARRRALLASPSSSAQGAWRRLLPAGAMATMMAIAGALWLAPPPVQTPPATYPVSTEAALAMAEESAQTLDDDPDFYLWLASEPIADSGFDAAPQFDKERTL